MDTAFYLDAEKFVRFIGDLADKVPKTPLTRDVVNRIIDYVEQNMEHKEFCPYGFTEIDKEVCGVCRSN